MSEPVTGGRYNALNTQRAPTYTHRANSDAMFEFLTDFDRVSPTTHLNRACRSAWTPTVYPSRSATPLMSPDRGGKTMLPASPNIHLRPRPHRVDFTRSLPRKVRQVEPTSLWHVGSGNNPFEPNSRTFVRSPEDRTRAAIGGAPRSLGRV